MTFLFHLLKLVRHGDCNPESIYPTDPWKGLRHWPEGFGQITKLGIRQVYDTGRYLRKRYKSLLGNGSFSEDIVRVQSERERNGLKLKIIIAKKYIPI